MHTTEISNGRAVARGHGHGGEFLIGLLCGTAVGAAIGLLVAPKTGAELRGHLADSAERLRRKAGETYGQASSTIGRIAYRSRMAVDAAVANDV